VLQPPFVLARLLIGVRQPDRALSRGTLSLAAARNTAMPRIYAREGLPYFPATPAHAPQSVERRAVSIYL